MFVQTVAQRVLCCHLQSGHLAAKAELDDVIVGLADAGVLSSIREHLLLFESLFVYQNEPLTADNYSWKIKSFHVLLSSIDQIIRLLTFSAEGSNDLQKEKTTYVFFVDLLEELEGTVVWGSWRFVPFPKTNLMELLLH